MKLQTSSLVLLTLVLCSAASAAQPEPRSWKVDGVERDGLVYVPEKAKSEQSPLVFVFQGHGGTARHAARTMSFHTAWPEAIVVYLQGLPTPGQLTDPEGKRAGWQRSTGDQEDRDLKFFDAVLASLRKDYQVDDKRIYSTGHSNGGGFTYLLWAARGDQFAAFAPSGAAALRGVNQMKPKPVLHVAGENDPLVKFTWQKGMIDALKKINGCGEGAEWEKEKLCTLYASKTGTPVVACIHPGGHEFLRDAPAIMVKFFKQHAKQ